MSLHPIIHTKANNNATIKYPRLILSTSIIASLFLLYIYFAPLAGAPLPAIINPHYDQCAFLTARFFIIILILLINYQYYINSSKGPNNFWNYDILICASTIILFFLSITAAVPIFMGSNLPANDFWGESAALIITFAAALKTYTLHILQKSADSLDQFVSLPAFTTVLDLDTDEEKQLPCSALQKDDIVIIKDKQIIPADGNIFWGNGSINESCLTGKKEKSDKSSGDKVFMGTINTKGTFHYRVSASQDNSVFTQLLNIKNTSITVNTATDLFALKISKYFTIFTLFMVVCTLILSIYLQKSPAFIFSLLAAIFVTGLFHAFISCTRIQFLTTLNKFARAGIFFKTPATIEQARHIDTVILGKTGILTKGHPVVTALQAEGITPKVLLALAASAEKDFDVPLARALVTSSIKNQAHLQRISSAQLLTGKGVGALINGDIIRVGKASWLEDEGVKISNELQIKAFQIAQEGGTPIFIALRKYCHGVLTLLDPLKYRCKAALALLQHMKINTILFTSDNKNTAKTIAKDLSIDQYRAELLPTDKAREIDLLHTHGLTIAAVGNADNDLPMLHAADIGVYLNNDIQANVVTAADVIIPANSLYEVGEMISYCQYIMKKIHRSFLFSGLCLFFILVGILISPLYFAQAAFLPIATAVLAGGLSFLHINFSHHSRKF